MRICQKACSIRHLAVWAVSFNKFIKICYCAFRAYARGRQGFDVGRKAQGACRGARPRKNGQIVIRQRTTTTSCLIALRLPTM